MCTGTLVSTVQLKIIALKFCHLLFDLPLIHVDCLQSVFSLKIRLDFISSSVIANRDVIITIATLGLRPRFLWLAALPLACLGFACNNFAKKNKSLLAV